MNQLWVAKLSLWMVTWRYELAITLRRKKSTEHFEVSGLYSFAVQDVSFNQSAQTGSREFPGPYPTDDGVFSPQRGRGVIKRRTRVTWETPEQFHKKLTPDCDTMIRSFGSSFTPLHEAATLCARARTHAHTQVHAGEILLEFRLN